MVASQQLVFTLTDADPKALVEAAGKIQKEAAREGLTVLPSDTALLSTRYTADTVRVAYLKQDGVDDLVAAALTRTTKKATARAEAIAAGLGMKLGGLVSAEELHSAAESAPLVSSSGFSRASGSGVSPAAELVEGELVRTVRVRVVYAVK